MIKLFLKNKFNLLVLAILLLAAFMRLYRIQDYMTFLGDEGRDSLVAYNILHGHFTLLGPTASVGGFYFGPIYYYFMAPFLLLFNYNPVGPAVMVALFGITTVYLVYKAGKEFFNQYVGLIAAFFYAITPLVVAYSRSSWNPNPIPFFSLLVVWFIYKGVTGSSKTMTRNFLFAGIALGIAVELHFIVAILGISILFYMLFAHLFIYKKNNQKSKVSIFKQYLYLAIGFLLGWMPYLGFELRHGFPNTRSVLNFVFHSGKLSGDNANFFMTIGNIFFRLYARVAAAFPPPEQLVNFAHPWIDIWYWGIIIIAIATTVLLLYQLKIAFTQKNTNKQAILLLLLLWLCGVIVFGIYKRQIYDYYLGFMFPLPFLLLANGFVYFWTKNILTKCIVTICFAGLLFVNLRGIPFRDQPNRQLHQTEEIAQFVNEKTNGKPFNFALITGGNSDHAYRYFFTRWHHEPVTIQNAVVDPERKTVTDQLLVVCESLPCKPLGHSLFEIAGFGRADIAGHWTVSVVEVYKLVPYRVK